MESKMETLDYLDVKEEKPKKRLLIDDIHCLHWLQEIGMEQYYETFRTNFTNGGDYLSRKRLAQVQIRHFPSMNITNFEHQKLLYKRITEVLEKEFVDQIQLAEERKKRERQAAAKKAMEEKLAAEEKEAYAKSVKGIVKEPSQKKINRKKRYSFEDKAWEIIHKSRGEKKANELLKDSDEVHVNFTEKENPKTLVRKPSVRRRSFEGGDLRSALDKAKMFGNMAMEFDNLQNKMIQMQQRYLNEIKDTVGCERVNLLFLSEKTRELMFCHDSKWYRIPSETGIPGYCIVTGETLNVPNASTDYRFNSYIDIATDFETRNVLCHPIRGNRGGGRVVGVIELLNKTGDTAFSSSDEEILFNMASQITEALYLEFQELVNINDSLSAFATPILPHTIEKEKARRNSNKKSYEKGTASSLNVSAQDKYKQVGAKKDLIDSQFTLGPDSQQKEKERARASRRKSFGEELNNEIKANPELLHVRKD